VKNFTKSPFGGFCEGLFTPLECLAEAHFGVKKGAFDPLSNDSEGLVRWCQGCLWSRTPPVAFSELVPFLFTYG
jgi:hypothetical protein